ncbi:MAG: ATP-dependent zinc metalloprotease FtsH [Acidobacteriota bacterium]
MEKTLKSVAIYLLILVIAAFAYKQYNTKEIKVDTIPYATFYSQVAEKHIKDVTVTAGEGVYKVTGHYAKNYKSGMEFKTNAAIEEKLFDYLRSNKVAVKVEPMPEPSIWPSLLTTFLPIILLVGFLIFIMQQTQGSGNRVMQFGRSKARLMAPESVKVTFQDVAGAEEAKEELQEVIEFLKSPAKFTQMGAKIPKGVLLFGAPGTGKTLMAKAVAGEAGVPFFSISGSDFVEMFVGVGAARVRDLFEQAKKNCPCIVFIDEIDAVGRQRGAGLGGGHDEREQTLNQLLVEMDGFATNEAIIVIAATNRPDILDPALLRPGRFDRHIVIDRPDVKGRQAILDVHVRNKPLDDDIKLEVLAKRTPGFTGADLANMVNEAALLTARRNKQKIGMREMEEAVERVIAGPEKKSRVISEKEKRLVAYHEAGHAVVSYYLDSSDRVHKISIIPRGRAAGYTLQLPEEDRKFETKSHLLDEVVTLLGGRVAECLVLNEISTGAQNDLERATGIVRRMITEYGMSEELGPLTFGHKEEEVFLGRDIGRDRNYSDAIAYAIDKEARNFVEVCYEKAKELLTKGTDRLHAVAERLMVDEILDGEDFEKIMGEGVTKEEV